MKTKFKSILTGILLFSGIFLPANCFSQNPDAFIKSYMNKLPAGKPEADGTLQKYRMTALYTNRDHYGKFTNKMKVTGDYTRGFIDSTAIWNNVYIYSSNSFSDPFSTGTKQDYMENFKYVPSGKMVEKEAFKDFPTSTENVFARNLIWDMLTFDTYAWNFSDSLKLNKPYVVSDSGFQFDMAEIGKYSHSKILLCWKGISELNGQLCSVIDFNAIDNILELSMPGINTKGTEQYWGTVWVSLKTRNIEQGIMYSGTNQEIEIKGMKDKMLMNTIRELYVDRIQ